MATERIGDILVEMKACTAQELQAALQTQTIFGGRIGTNLLELGIIDEKQLAAALTKAYGFPCLAGEIQPDMEAIAAVPAHVVEKLGFVPLHVDDRKMKVVVADPRDLQHLDEVAFATGKTIEPVLATEARVWALMYRFYGIEKHLRGLEVLGDDLDDAATDRGAEVGIGTAAPVAGPRALTVQEALDKIAEVSDPVVLSALLVRGAGGRAGRVVLLKCQGPRATAWLAAGPLLEADVRGVEFDLQADTPFGDAVELRAPVLAPVKPGKSTARFLEALGGAPPMNAFAGPVILRGRAVALLYADAGPRATLHDEAADLIVLIAALNRRFQELAPVSAPTN